MICRAIDSPSPLPPLPRPRAGSPRQNRSKTYGSASRAMPQPVSTIRTTTDPAARLASNVTRPPAGVARKALVMRLPNGWRNRSGSPCRVIGSARTVNATRSASARARWAVRQVSSSFRYVDRTPVVRQLPRLRQRQILQVIDDSLLEHRLVVQAGEQLRPRRDHSVLECLQVTA